MNSLLLYEVGASGNMDPIELGRGSIVLGSGPTSNVIVPNPGGVISRAHLKISFQDGRYLISDLNSTNGTSIIRRGSSQNEKIGEHAVTLDHGDMITLANALVFRFHDPTVSTVKQRLSRRSVTPHLIFSESEPVIELDGANVLLTQKEFEILKFMNSNLGEFCSKGSLMKIGWPQETLNWSGAERSNEEMTQVPGLNESLQQLMSKIRQKIEVIPSQPNMIITMPKYGYKLQDPTAE